MHKTSNFNQAKFSAIEYDASRPFYPAAVFDLLRRSVPAGADLRFLDLGCGTGLSTLSFLAQDLGRAGFGVEPDPEMLAAAVARGRADERARDVAFLAGRAEAIPLPDAAVDLVLVGSAIHWFDRERAPAEIARVLRPGGWLYVFEYQFPRAADDPVLNEKIRRRFNLEWKAPVQRPRGSLRDLLEPFHRDPRWESAGDARPDWRERLGLDAFLGHLHSQSRYLHAEAAQTDAGAYRAAIRAEIAPHFAGREPPIFDFGARARLLRASGKR